MRHLKPVQLFTVYLPVLLIDFAFSGLLTNTSFYSSKLGLTSTFLGVLMAIPTAFFACCAIPFGWFSDRSERRYMLYAACVLVGGVSLGLPFCRSKLHLLLIFPGVGISMALFWPAYEAWLAEREGEGKLIQRMMLFNLFWSIGVTLGPTASSYLYRDANPFMPFYLASVLSVLTLVTIFSHKPTSSDHGVETVPETIEPLYPSLTVRTIYLNLARCANFASWFTLGILRQLAPKLTLEMGIPPKVFGNFMLTLGGVQTLAFLVLGTGYSTRWHYRFGPLLIVQGAAILSFVGIWRFQHTALWICAFTAIGMSVAFTYFSSLYYGLDRHTDKGNKSGWHEAVLAVGTLLGPLLGGIAADSQSEMWSPYLLCAVAIGIAIAVEVSIYLITAKQRT